MGYHEAFDSAVCLDAMELIFPEDWLLVLSNLHHHYYPKIEQVKEWVQQAGFRLIDETVGDEYHHFLVQKHQ